MLSVTSVSQSYSVEAAPNRAGWDVCLNRGKYRRGVAKALRENIGKILMLPPNFAKVPGEVRRRAHVRLEGSRGREGRFSGDCWLAPVGAVSRMSRMPAPLPASVVVEVRCIRIPNTCGGAPIHLGVQRQREPVGVVAAALGEATFSLEFRLADRGGTPNFLGPYAQGSREERFFYITWGRGGSAATFQMFRRLKVHLSHLTWRHIETAIRRNRPLHVEIDATDRCGGPRCGSAWPDDAGISWDTR
jgi:hypothetical protein